MDSSCPCGSPSAYSECCGPIIEGQTPAPTAEALMRARYTAFARQRVDFIMDSLHPTQKENTDEGHIRKWSQKSDWLGLEIVDTVDGGPDDTTGQVEFIARFMEKGVRQRHHERAEFRKVDDRWTFYDGEPVPIEPFVRSNPKTGRNDPCPCGSGRKFKKCCGP